MRNIEKITKAPVHDGFLGAGHTAVAVIDGQRYLETDPFILLMDDRLDLPGGPPVGGPHPHAGFETVTLVLNGNGTDWKAGTLELMTAGSGVIHTEEITAKQQVRILQFWLVLPPESRWTAPFWQQIELESVPTVRSEMGEIRVYSGTSQGVTSPLVNRTPFTLVDFIAEPDAQFSQTLPASHRGFVYAVSGDVNVGDKTIREGELGWLDQPGSEAETEVTFTTNGQSRFVLFAGKPHNVPVVHHGPFVGDDHADIRRLFQEYRLGSIPHLNELPETSKVQHDR
jgi:quercetin 2,3-dioxygenase